MTTNPPHITGGLDMDAIYHRRRTPAPATTMQATTATPAHRHKPQGRTLGADAATVLAALRRHPHGVTITGLTGDLANPPENLPKVLSNLRQQGYVVNLAPRGAAAVYVCQNHQKATKGLALAQPRNTGFCVNPKSADRLAIEAALQQAGTQHQTAQQLADATGQPLERVKNVLRNMASKDKLHCLPAVPSAGEGEEATVNPNAPHRYALAAEIAKAEAAARAAQRQAGPPLRNSTTTEQNWCPPWLRTSAINHSARPGAQDAFTKPSLVGGVLVPHKTPASMGTGAGKSAMAIGGGRRFAE